MSPVYTTGPLESTEPNDPWRAYDVLWPDGKRTEVKSTSYLQTWKSRKPNPKCVCGPTIAWSEEEGYAKEATWNADIYVLSYYFETDLEKVDVMNLDKWKFWVFNKEEMPKLMKTKAITIMALERAGYRSLTAFELRQHILG